MKPVKAKAGMRVHFAHEGKEFLVGIFAGEVESIIFRGTTNEYFQIKMVDVESGCTSRIEKKAIECFKTAEEARKAALIKLYQELDRLREKFSCLGDHLLAKSHWKKD